MDNELDQPGSDEGLQVDTQVCAMCEEVFGEDSPIVYVETLPGILVAWLSGKGVTPSASICTDCLQQETPEVVEDPNLEPGQVFLINTKQFKEATHKPCEGHHICGCLDAQLHSLRQQVAILQRTKKETDGTE